MARRKDLLPEGGIGTRAGLPPAAGEPFIELGDLRRGQFFAQSGDNVVSNVPGLQNMGTGVPRRADFSRALEIGRDSRTRGQQQDLARIARRQERLQKHREGVAELSLTREGKQRAAASRKAEETRRLAQAAGERRRQDAAAQELQLARIPGEARLQERQLIGEQAAGLQQAGAAASAAAQAAELEFRREELGVKQAEVASKLQSAADLARQQGLFPGTPEFQAVQTAEIDKLVAEAEAKGDVQGQLAALKQGYALQKEQFGAQLDMAFEPKDNRADITDALPVTPAVATPQRRSPTPTATQPAVQTDANRNGVPDNMERFIPNIARLEASTDPAQQEQARVARQKMMDRGLSKEAIDSAIRAFSRQQQGG